MESTCSFFAHGTWLEKRAFYIFVWNAASFWRIPFCDAKLSWAAIFYKLTGCEDMFSIGASFHESGQNNFQMAWATHSFMARWS